MAHNFSKSGGDRFVRKGGDNNTADNTGDNPFRTIKAAKITNFTKMIVGDGEYFEELGTEFTPYITGEAHNDGVVVLNGYGLGTGHVNEENDRNMLLLGFEVKNFYHGIQAEGDKAPEGLAHCVLRDNVVNINAALSVQNSVFELRFTLLLNGTEASIIENVESVLNNITIVNDHLKLDNISADAYILRNIYVHTDATIEVLDGANFTKFQNCNIRGTIIYNSTSYTLATFTTAFGAKVENCIDSDPLFIDAANDVYYVESGSPNLSSGYQGAFIGAFGFLGYKDNTEIDSSSGVSIGGSDEATLSSSPTGQITYTFEDLGEDKILGRPIITGTEDWLNKQVVDTSESGSGTDKPNFRTIDVRYTTEAEGSDLLVSKTFRPFIRNNIMVEDGTGKANGENGFNPATAVPVSARYVQIRITLRDNFIHS